MTDRKDETDRKFIQAVDTILEAHSKINKEPSSANGLTQFISNDRGIISRIRSGSLHASSEIVRRLSVLCNLDINFFYKHNIDFRYNPDEFNPDNIEISDSGGVINNVEFKNDGDSTNSVQLGTGDISGSFYNKEVIHQSGTHVHFHKAETLVNELPDNIGETISNELSQIKQGYSKIETELQERTDALKKMTDQYMAESKANSENMKAVLEQLQSERKAREHIYNKYIEFLESRNNIK